MEWTIHRLIVNNWEQKYKLSSRVDICTKILFCLYRWRLMPEKIGLPFKTILYMYAFIYLFLIWRWYLIKKYKRKIEFEGGKSKRNVCSFMLRFFITNYLDLFMIIPVPKSLRSNPMVCLGSIFRLCLALRPTLWGLLAHHKFGPAKYPLIIFPKKKT